MSSAPERNWIIYLAAIICAVLALAGGLMYPMNLRDPLEIILFEVVTFLILFALVFLIYQRGLPDAVTEARKQPSSD
jgi:heme A synthase